MLSDMYLQDLGDEIAGLKAENAALEAENAKLKELLGECRKAIANVPDMKVFGIGGGGMAHWYLGEELLHNIDNLLGRA